MDSVKGSWTIGAISRRDALLAGGALASIALLKPLPSDHRAEIRFSTGSPAMDGALGGGLRPGSLLVVIGPRYSGKSDFLLRLAKANGIVDAHAMNQGTSDMLSIMQRHDGQYIGSIVLNNVEPSTEKERADMERDPGARDAFLTRWFRRSKEVLHESGGVFALSVIEPVTSATAANWMSHADYIIQAEDSTYRLIKSC